MIGLFTLLAAQAAAPPAQAKPPAPPPPSAMEAIAAVQLPITESAPGVYSGAGWDQLIADGAKAQFFLIGEQHLTHDIATFAKAAQKTLAERGYTHGAFEVGPYSMRHAEALIRSGPGKLSDYIRQPGHALVYPFLFFTEEVDLMQQVVASSPDKKHALWGLDQEFAASAPIAVELLQGWAKTDAQREAVKAFQAKVAATPQLVAEKPWSEFAAVEAAFANNPEAAQYLSELKLSNVIYEPFTGRGGSGYEANLTRETYMKRNFVSLFNEAEKRTGKSPKVFMKFGGYHAQKGFTGTNVPGLANFLYEWGLSRDFAMVNVMVECVGGLARNPQTQGTIPCQPYFNKDALLSKMPKANRLTLVDLRPLRKQLRRLPDLDQESRQVILSFDYYLAIKDVTPGTVVAAK